MSKDAVSVSHVRARGPDSSWIREAAPDGRAVVAFCLTLLVVTGMVSTASAGAFVSPTVGDAGGVTGATATATVGSDTGVTGTASVDDAGAMECDDPLAPSQGGVDGDTQIESGYEPVEVERPGALAYANIDDLLPGVASKRCASSIYDFPDGLDEITLTLYAPEDTDYDIYVTLDGRRATPASFDKRSSGGTGVAERIVLNEDDIPRDGKIGIAVRVFEKNQNGSTTAPPGCPTPCLGSEFQTPPPTARIDAPAVVRPDETFELDGSGSTVPNDSDATYEWRVDGERIGSGEQLRTELLNEGTHEVTLNVTGTNGYSDTASTSIEVQGRPVPEVVARADLLDSSGPPVYVREKVTVSGDRSNCSEGNITGYEWSLPNGSTATGETIPYRFTDNTTTSLELTVTCRRSAALGGGTVTDSTTVSASPEFPEFMITSVDQQTPFFEPLGTLVGCDNLGVITATVTGTQDAEFVEFNIGKKTIRGEKIAENGRNEVYRIDRADAFAEDPPWADSNANAGFSKKSLEVFAKSTAGATDRETTGVHFTNLPGMMKLSKNVKDNARSNAGGRCSLAFKVALMGEPKDPDYGAAKNQENPAKSGKDAESAFDSVTEDSSTDPSAGSSASPPPIGPLIPKQLASSVPVINDWSLGLGVWAKYNAEGQGDMGTLSLGGLVYGRVSGGTGVEGSLFALGIMAIGFDVSNDYSFSIGKLWSIIILQGELDLSSLFTGPFPYEINTPVGSFEIDPPIFVELISGAKIIADIGGGPGGIGPIGELRWDDLSAKMKGSPAFAITGGLGYREESLPCDCEVSFSVTGAIRTGYFQIYDEFAPDGVSFSANIRAHAGACYQPIGFCLTWQKRLGHWDLGTLGGRLAASGAAPAAGDRTLAVGPRASYSPDHTVTRTVGAQKRAGPSPARALLGDTETQETDSSRATSVTPT